MPTGKEAPKKTYDHEVPGRSRAMDPDEKQSSDKERQRELDKDDA